VREVPLGELCDFRSGGTPDRKNADFYGGSIPWITGADIAEEAITPRSWITQNAVEKSAANVVPAGTVLLVSRTSVGKATIADRDLAFSQDVTAISPKNDVLDRRYLLHFLRKKQGYFTRHARGATIKGITRRVVGALSIPVLPIDEQRRIADILDKSDALRAQRRQVINHLDALSQSIFHEMFGDPGATPRVTLSDVLRSGLRNGLSPSTSGAVTCEVLTLSAITGSELDLSQKKTALFDSEFHAAQFVRPGQILICRGNGNKALVGKGKVVREDVAGVGYPDTIIAGDINTAIVEPAFLHSVWDSVDVRGQIERGARTTNGTYKVNQTLLGSISFPLPQMEKQQEFAGRISTVERLKATHRSQLGELDSLFHSLQDRAFKGEL
jgi:type I restriction enzyme, S subunit